MRYRFAILACVLFLAGCGSGVDAEDPPPPPTSLRCSTGADAMSHAALMASYANPLLVVDSADFDGTNDYMTRGAGLTNAADSKTGILSMWVRLDTGGDFVTLAMLSSSRTAGGAPTNSFVVQRSFATNRFLILARDAANTTTALHMRTFNVFNASATWLHLLASWDLAAGATHLYINDVSDRDTVSAVDTNIDYTYADWSVGAHPDATIKFAGCIADAYFAPGQYLDFSLVANRRKFISASGKPVHLGATGALPTGVAPIVYQHLDNGEAVANFATNRGTGGNFTITGTLDTGSSSPSD